MKNETIWALGPAKTRVNQGIHPVSPEPSLCIMRIKEPSLCIMGIKVKIQADLPKLKLLVLSHS